MSNKSSQGADRLPTLTAAYTRKHKSMTIVHTSGTSSYELIDTTVLSVSLRLLHDQRVTPYPLLHDEGMMSHTVLFHLTRLVSSMHIEQLDR